jgi:hypothetical protein
MTDNFYIIKNTDNKGKYIRYNKETRVYFNLENGLSLDEVRSKLGNNKNIIKINGKTNMNNEITKKNLLDVCKSFKNIFDIDNTIIIFSGTNYDEKKNPFTLLLKLLKNKYKNLEIYCLKRYNNKGLNSNTFYTIWKNIGINFILTNISTNYISSILSNYELNIGSFNLNYLITFQKLNEAIDTNSLRSLNIPNNMYSVNINELNTDIYKKIAPLLIKQNPKLDDPERIHINYDNKRIHKYPNIKAPLLIKNDKDLEQLEKSITVIPTSLTNILNILNSINISKVFTGKNLDKVIFKNKIWDINSLKGNNFILINKNLIDKSSKNKSNRHTQSKHKTNKYTQSKHKTNKYTQSKHKSNRHTQSKHKTNKYTQSKRKINRDTKKN